MYINNDNDMCLKRYSKALLLQFVQIVCFLLKVGPSSIHVTLSDDVFILAVLTHKNVNYGGQNAQGKIVT